MAATDLLCIPALLRTRAEQLPDAPAILAPGREALTYRHVEHHMHHVAQRLQALGLGGQDRIAMVLPNGPETAVAALTVASVATCVPLNPAYGAREYDFILGRCGQQR